EVWGDPAPHLDLVDHLDLRRVGQLERRAPGAEDLHDRAVAPGVGLLLGHPDDVAEEAHRFVEVLGMNDQSQLLDPLRHRAPSSSGSTIVLAVTVTPAIRRASSTLLTRRLTAAIPACAGGRRASVRPDGGPAQDSTP